nr:unnamed protein product [Digitaria exilis]
MAIVRSSALLLLAAFLTILHHATSAPPAAATSAPSSDTASFLRCLTVHLPPQVLYTSTSPSYTSVLESSIKNLLFVSPATPTPLAIITATNASHVQATVRCGALHGVRVRPRSGGHDYEGLSYRSLTTARPFAVVDLAALRTVRVDAGRRKAWVGSGATLGELSCIAFASASGATDAFLGCLAAAGVPPRLVQTPASPSYDALLLSPVRNLRYVAPGTPRPVAIVAAAEPAHAQAAVRCGRRHGVRLRVRSGGHDYEGLSYASLDRRERFAVLDLAALREVRVDAARAEAWAGSGATLGDYAKAKVWGEKYFKGNFERLAAVKAMVDPDDFFRNEQSIPPLPSAKGWSPI